MFQLLLIAATSLQVVVVIVWLWQHVLMNRLKREGLRVPVYQHEPSSAKPSVTVIIPARDEASQIGDCLRSVTQQTFPNMAIIIADDRSTDDTSKRALQAAPNHLQPTIIRIDSLPHDWLGKSHALWAAAQQAHSDWLLFMDADCRLLPHALTSAIQYSQNRQLDLLSLWPRDGSQGFWENVLIPLCGAQIVIWYGANRVNDPDHHQAFANGQFILIRREKYLQIGGHSSVKDAIIEDIPLAKHAKESGLKALSALGSDIYTVRMYHAFRDILNGWQRIYVGVLKPTQILLCMLWLVVGSALPFVIIPVAAAALPGAATAWPLCWLSLGIVHLIVLVSVSIRFFSLSYCRLGYLFLYPLSVVGVFFILSQSFLKSIGRQAVTWKGTTYQVSSARITGRT